MKKLLLALLCAPLLMTGCLNNSDYEQPTMPEFTFNQLRFKGKMTVKQPGSESVKFTWDDVEFAILPPADPSKDQRVTLSLKNVCFVEQMPIDCTFPNLILMAWPSNNLLTAQPADGGTVYPYSNGKPIEEYKTTDLLVAVTFVNDQIAKGGVEFRCNSMEVTIIGDPIKNGSDNEPPTMPTFTFDQLKFKGKLTSKPLPGSEFAEFTQEDVEFAILPPADSEKDSRVTLSLKNVRFVEQMPVSIACTYPNLNLMEWPYDKHLTVEPADEEPIYPYYNGLPLDIDKDGNPDEAYKTTDLLVDVVFTNDKITKGSVKFHCYTMAVEIVGDPIQ